MRFNGSDYDRKEDDARLSEQHQRIKVLMLDHKWRTLNEIAHYTGDPEASISAQLRHLRKERFGSYVLEKRSRGDRKRGLFEYRVMPPGYDSEFVVTERTNKYKDALTAVWKHKDTTPALKNVIREFFKK